jgi:hypothetical protein
MVDSNDPRTSGGDPLDALIAEYVQQVEAGAVPDREALLARHPDLADRLRAFFADCDHLDRQAADLRLSADPNRTTDSTAAAATLPRVRYFGDYELLEVLARGGMGVVYKARQVSLNRLVALKMILKGELATPRDVARFRSEAEAAANLDHPHIVPIYEVGEHDGQQYYAMRLVEGTSLAGRPRSGGRREAALVATVARAVHYAHQRGLLHRDLKPSNILVDGAGAPLVADFGLAKRVDAEGSLTEPGALVGTPRYMAPEQATGRKDLTVAADVYSLGVVLYERLTGQPPFTGEAPLEVLRQVREAEPPRPSSITPGLSRDLETICLKCLEKDPAKRYASAEALADDLERWLRGEPIQARPVGQAERLWRWCRRNPALAGLSAGLVTVLLAGTAISITFAVRAEDKAEAERNERERAEKAEKVAVRAQDELELALARSLVRPLQQQGGDALTAPEAEALWELAEKPGDLLWQRFLKEAARTPMTSSQLAGRMEPALIAAVGLDSEKRRRAEQILLGALEASEMGAQQDALAYVAASLGELEPPTSQRLVEILKGKRWDLVTNLLQPAEAAQVLAQALENTRDPNALVHLANGLVGLAAQLEPAVAARTARALEQVLEKAPNGYVRSQLAEGLLAMAARLGHAEAARTVQVLGQALEEEKDVDTRRRLAIGLANAAGRLGPAEATQAARVLGQALQKEQASDTSPALAVGLANQATRLGPAEAALAARVLGHALEKETQPGTRQQIASGLARVTAWLGPAEAAETAGVLVPALQKQDTYTRGQLTIGLSTVAGRMVPADGAQILAQALDKETDPNTRGQWADGLAGLAARLEPAEAAQAARDLQQALQKESGAFARSKLVDALGCMAGRLEPPEAARVRRGAARVLAQALEKEKQTGAPSELALNLASVEAPLGPAEAAQAARVWGQALETDPGRTELAHALAEVAARLEPREATRVLRKAVAVLGQALEKDVASSNLASNFAVVAACLEPAERDQVFGRTYEALLRALAATPEGSEYWFSQVRTCATVLQGWDSPRAEQCCKGLARSLAGSFAVNSARLLFISYIDPGSESLDIALTQGTQGEKRRRATAVATALGVSLDQPLGALPALSIASKPVPCRLSTQDLVNLLKMPTCFGKARKVVLKHLSNRYGRTFANHWEFVRFAREQHLDLDFTAPPRRPSRP